jgi:hypothetical protein
MACILQAYPYISGAMQMNYVPNVKIGQLCQQLTNIDTAIINSGDKMTSAEVRIAVDTHRHNFALLEREILIQDTQEISSAYTQPLEVQQFIEAWRDQIKTAQIETVSYDNRAFCDLLLDHTLPKSWNFNEDIVVIHEPPSRDILESVKSRNQKHIIIYTTTDIAPTDVSYYATQNAIAICTSAYDLERTVALLQTRAQQVISISCDESFSRAQDAKKAITEAVNAGKRTRKENTATVSKFGGSWAVNVLKNMPKIQNAKNLHQLKISGVEDAVIVASGPSLGKNIDKLKGIQDSVFIVAALRSLPILNAAGVEADLVIQLDAEDDIVAQKLSPDGTHPVKNLLLEGTVNPGFFALPAQNIIWSLAQHFFDIHQEFGTKPTPFNVPSVSIYGLQLCQFLKFKNICFIGQDLAASAGKQYANGATDLLPAHSNISMFQIEVPGFYGNTVMTRNSYEYQIKRCSELAKEWQSQQLDLNLVNATEGGAYIQGFDHMTFEQFIGKRQLQNKKSNKSIDFLANIDIETIGISSYRRRIHDTMGKISTISDKIIKLDGQREKTRGLDKKIKKMVHKFQELNNSTSLLQIAMQDGIARVIGTSRTNETVDSYSQFFEKIKDNAEALKAAAKQ